MLADVSASMGYVGRYDKLEQLRRVAVALAQTAWRNGDAFGFYAASDMPQRALTLPVRVNRGAADWLERRLSAFTPAGDSARGLLRVIPHLPHRRALVFVVSDFHWPEGDLDELLRGSRASRRRADRVARSGRSRCGAPSRHRGAARSRKRRAALRLAASAADRGDARAARCARGTPAPRLPRAPVSRRSSCAAVSILPR